MGTNIKMTKQASPAIVAAPLLGTLKNVPLGLLGASLAIGTAGGLTLAGIVGGAKNKPAKLRIAEEERKFYDAKVKELANENWLNDMLTLRKKLESKNLSEEERRATEKEYLRLIEANVQE